MPHTANLETRINTLLDGRITLHQPVSGYRAAIDPVFLAAAAPAAPGMRVLDAGCGVGTAALCLAARVDGLHITGMDIQPELAELAARNADENDMGDTCRFITGDIINPPGEIGEQEGAFDIVIINPPFLDPADHSPSPSQMRNIAHAGAKARLDDWTGFAMRMLKPKGRMVIIHRADHLPQIMRVLSGTFGGISVYPLWPRTGRSAKRVLIGAISGSKAPAVLLPGMVLHDGETDSAYTQAAHDVLYDAGGIDLWP